MRFVIGFNRERPSLSSPTSLLLMGFIAICLGVTSASAAQAYKTAGCRYKTDSINPISYRFFSVSKTNESSTKYGATAWNDTSAPGYFKEQSNSLDPEVNITDDPFPKENAYAWVASSCNKGFYRGNEVNLVWNTSLISTRTKTQKKRIATHELGHAYGLGHVTKGCHIMRVDIGYLADCNRTTPSTDDIKGVKSLY